jgi:hypothetical protein
MGEGLGLDNPFLGLTLSLPLPGLPASVRACRTASAAVRAASLHLFFIFATFPRKEVCLLFYQYQNTPLLLLQTFIFLRVAIHSAVHVSMGEADEIATQSLCGFCGKISENP